MTWFCFKDQDQTKLNNCEKNLCLSNDKNEVLSEKPGVHPEFTWMHLLSVSFPILMGENSLRFPFTRELMVCILANLWWDVSMCQMATKASEVIELLGSSCHPFQDINDLL